MDEHTASPKLTEQDESARKKYSRRSFCLSPTLRHSFLEPETFYGLNSKHHSLHHHSQCQNNHPRNWSKSLNDTVLQERMSCMSSHSHQRTYPNPNPLSDVVEVPEDSPDAKKWPLWQQPQPSSSSPPPPSTPLPKPRPPGPRKPKTSLTALPTPSSQKAKKLSTLDKSAMDWRAHLDSQQDSTLKHELEANRRGGGYLEKVEFLKRVEDRKEDALDAVKSRKHRKL